MLADFDQLVQDYVNQLRACEGVINSYVVLAAAIGIVESKNRSLLKEYGGQIAIERRLI